ncbi:M48 family metallopeptidase [Singulisphaera sp. PoT]|uniref:M48 family metallopeptidase n=1 Tax=Singulisphaera sp. PoT TaxID=3411797 RepID=UPI003BF55C45
MDRGQPPRGLLCPECGTGLEPIGEGTRNEHRLLCRHCGVTFRARRRNDGEELTGLHPTTGASAGPFSLFWRRHALSLLEANYRFGVVVASSTLLLFGGFVPIVRGWLKDEINDWSDVLSALGGVYVITETKDPDADLGPVLARSDAPLIFTTVDEVARKLGVKSPGQVRLTYLPCCGVVAWGNSQALILGLPLLRVLNLGELRAILAHELAHLARGDATKAAHLARFVEGLRRALDHADGREHGPLGSLARFTFRWSARLIGPIARGQETRADRSAATIAGGSAAASALVKVALVQPLFREVLEHYDPEDPEVPNLYAFFRAFWYRLPAEVHSAMRIQVLTSEEGANDPAHPPLPDRITILQSYPDPPQGHSDNAPATSFLGDLESLEQMLHNRLFGLPAIEPSVFHRARV